MKKRLLMQFFAFLCVVGAYADGYIYSQTAKFKILGENMVTNGSFNVGDGTEGWTNELGEAIDGSIWGVETNAGPNGENAIKSLGAADGEGQSLYRTWQLTPGFYTISYWVKSPSVTTSSVTAGSTNYTHFYLTSESSDSTAVAGPASFMTDWSQVVITAEVSTDATLVFKANNVASDIMFTNFEIHQAVEVYDTRIAYRYINDIERILNEPDFIDGSEEIAFMLGVLKEILANNPEESTEIDPLIEEIEPKFQEFIDSKAGNTIGTYLTDWSTWGYMNWNNMVNRNTWSFEGGRWGFSPNNGDLERPEGDGYVASAGIQTSYKIGPEGPVGVRTAVGAFDGTSMKAGRYMFSIEAQAVAASNKATPYGANHSIIIAEPSIWIGKDTTFVANDTLNGFYWKRYYTIVDITDEDLANGKEVAGGFIFPWLSETSQGGRYSLRNPQFRVVGKSQEEVNHLYAYDQLAVQQNALKQRLDSATVVNTLTHAAGYPWGHAVLQEAIDTYTNIFNDLLTVVNANGEELQPDRVTLEYKDEILAAVRNMNNAISTFYATNKHYQTLISDIALCNASLNAEANAAGDKATFKAVIDRAQAMVNATTVDANEMDAFDQMDDEMLTAKETFEMGTASRANPANLYVKSKSLNFEPWASKSTYSSDKTGENAVNGWNITIGTDGKQWDVAPSTIYKRGKGASIWRGSTVGPNGKMQQSITITKPGVYEFRSRAFAAEYGDAAKWDQYMMIANICGANFDPIEFIDTPIDTVYHPNVRLFFGPEGSVNDSITLTKCNPEDYLRNPANSELIYTRGTPMEYSIIYVKKSSDPEIMEYGLEAYENGATAGANTFGFGDNQLLYLGSEEAYAAATDADLNAEIAKAKALITQYGVETSEENPNNLAWIVYKLMRLVGDANYPWAEGLGYTAPQTLQEKQNVYLTLLEYEDMIKLTLDPSLAGIQEVNTDGTAAREIIRKGIFNLNGVRMQGDMKSLPAGLYIVNGKKYVVK